MILPGSNPSRRINAERHADGANAGIDGKWLGACQCKERRCGALEFKDHGSFDEGTHRAVAIDRWQCQEACFECFPRGRVAGMFGASFAQQECCESRGNRIVVGNQRSNRRCVPLFVAAVDLSDQRKQCGIRKVALCQEHRDGGNSKDAGDVGFANDRRAFVTRSDVSHQRGIEALLTDERRTEDAVDARSGAPVAHHGTKERLRARVIGSCDASNVTTGGGIGACQRVLQDVNRRLGEIDLLIELRGSRGDAQNRCHHHARDAPDVVEGLSQQHA